ncbi:MAG: cell division protein FtsL [Gammaproteobacteria bacterium]|nr:MAG: cell division protein FtsL [Gammaproteobacteria bacterium]RKZ95417.1 MAG: cell division protein FtsL [Gammaproteobacteria bacterium]RKZ98536.1 MAG: cell division protein FtsL [Gammaproteobacteria bacterium]RKZ99978.1 MAG: cell division protein FtsL [Gammaproteobacteria bacterium]
MSFSSLIDLLRIHVSVILLIVLVIASSIAVIYTKHTGRTEFVALQKLERQRDNLNEEWSRLLLEQSTWASPGRIEQQARLRLKMIVPTADMVVVVKP